MTDEQIKNLLKEGEIETSEMFVEETLDKLDRRLLQRMRTQLYLLIGGIILFLIVSTYILISTGFALHFFSIEIEVPKYLSIILTTLISYALIFYLRLLVPNRGVM